MNDLAVRTASGVAMVAVVAGSMWLGGIIWAGICIAIAAGIFWEWRGLVGAFRIGAVTRAVWLIAGLVYIFGAASGLIALRETFGFIGVLAVAGAVWAVDIGAYFAGRAIGGPKIAPRISPSKTWAGLIGGIFGACAVLALTTGLHNWWFGVPVALLAQTGDFFESAMKRRAGVKDSGALLPGHGGLFDRADGVLPVALLCGAYIAIILAPGL